MIRGGLFTRYFLEDGIRETEAYRSQEIKDIVAFVDIVRGCWADLADMSTLQRRRQRQNSSIRL
jgi:hypothetical protein